MSFDRCLVNKHIQLKYYVIILCSVMISTSNHNITRVFINKHIPTYSYFKNKSFLSNHKL